MNGGRLRLGVAALAAIGLLGGTPLIAAPHSPWQMAQVPPSPEDISGYRGLHAAVAAGDLEAVRQVQAGSAALSARDREGRTPLHVAAHLGNHALVALLLAKGADGNALDAQLYDVITIAAVRNDAETIRLALRGGASPRAVTSPNDGTALIATAHLGNVEAVRTLIDAGAAIDHVNNLNWTALIEAIVLGDGGARHREIVRLLIAGRADLNRPDRSGTLPLTLARQRGYAEIEHLLEAAGALP